LVAEIVSPAVVRCSSKHVVDSASPSCLCCNGGCQVLLVSWQPPPPHSRNGVITGYKIRYKPRGERTRSVNVVTDGISRSHELNGNISSKRLVGTCIVTEPPVSSVQCVQDVLPITCLSHNESRLVMLLLPYYCHIIIIVDQHVRRRLPGVPQHVR